MGLFSGRNERLATMWGAQQLLNGQTTATAALQGAEGKALDALDTGKAEQIDMLERGYGRARDDYDNSIAMFSPWSAQGLKAYNAMGDATGLNGDEGYNRAVGTFRESPGYRYRVDQALDGVNRHQASTGMLASGNTLAALSERAGHEADQEWGDWYNRVNGISDRGYDATGKGAALTAKRGDLGYTLASAGAAVAGAGAARRASIVGNTGNQPASIDTKTADGLNDSSKNAFGAGDDASKNSWSV